MINVPSTFRFPVLVIIYAMSSFQLAAAAEEPAKTWPQWRGPTRDGQVPSDNWPERLSDERLTKLWRVDLEGPSFSGPIVTDKIVFVTETRDEKTEHVTALNRATGKKMWEASWPGAMTVSPIGQAAGSWIRSTPAFDEGRLYVLGMCDLLVCLDAAAGKEIWRLDCPKEFNSDVPDFGGVSSPLVHGDAVFVQAGGGFVKADKITGKVLWRVLEKGPGKSQNGAFSSPILARIGGEDRMLVQTREELAAVDPGDGKTIWKFATPSLFGMSILTPTVYGDGIFTSSMAGTSLFAAAKQKNVDKEAAPGEVLWKNSLIGYMASPVVYKDHVYLHLRNERLACIDLKTGKRAWASEPLGEHASMVAQKDRILHLNDNGRLRLIRATPKEFDVLGQAQVIPEKGNWGWAHLAITNCDLFVRDLKGVTAFRWK